MFAWFSEARTCASRSNRDSRSALVAYESGSSFRATSRCNRESRPRKTTPMPPSPSWAVTSYGPTREPGERAIGRDYTSGPRARGWRGCRGCEGVRRVRCGACERCDEIGAIAPGTLAPTHPPLLSRSLHSSHLFHPSHLSNPLHLSHPLSFQISHRRVDAAAAERDLGKAEAHLDAAEHSGERELVEVAEVPETHRAPLQPAESGPERHVEPLENDAPHAIGIDTGWHHDRRHGVAVFVGTHRAEFQSPRLDRLTSGFSEPAMACEDLRQALFLEHANLLAQAVEQVGSRRIREVARGVRRLHRVPGPVGARQTRRAGGSERLLADGLHRQARRQHQPLLRPCDGDVDAPLV